MTQANDGPAIVDLEPAVARAITGWAGAMIARPARPMRRQDLSIAGRDGDEIALRSYHPVERNGDDVAPVLVFYQGGWVLGEIAGYDALCSEIAQLLGFTLVSVGYRLAPEHRFPATDPRCDRRGPLGACRYGYYRSPGERVDPGWRQREALPAVPAAAAQAVDEEVRLRVRASGKTNISRAVSELPPCCTAIIRAIASIMKIAARSGRRSIR